MRRRALLLASLLFLPARAGHSQGAGPVNAEGGLGIAGHDPVAYFTETRAVPGRAEIATVHEGVTYRFASEANRAAFLAEPARYLPQYGGYCAYGMARGYKAVVDPAAFTVTGGRLYLNYNHSIAAQWQRDRAREIARADGHWPKVMHSPEVAR
jgi:YHS domain-containing protein